MRFDYHTLRARFLLRFRRQRMRRFFQMFAPAATTRVLDIGGTRETWTKAVEGLGDTGAHFPVTMLNRRSGGASAVGQLIEVEGDATQLPFADNGFDIAFSNSVIEHVGEWEQQQAFAREARRVARALWIQTPARSFPIEAHLLAPYIQYLPRRAQHRIVRWTPRGLLSAAEAHEIVDEVRLLTYRDMQQLFPDCEILRERVLGITKSYIAVRGAEAR